MFVREYIDTLVFYIHRFSMMWSVMDYLLEFTAMRGRNALMSLSYISLSRYNNHCNLSILGQWRHHSLPERVVIS